MTPNPKDERCRCNRKSTIIEYPFTKCKCHSPKQPSNVGNGSVLGSEHFKPENRGLGQEGDDTKPVIQERTLTETSPSSFELLAELEHKQWQEWASNIWKTEPNLSIKRKERWAKTLLYPYEKLTEKEKNQDRKWVKKVMKIVERDYITRKEYESEGLIEKQKVIDAINRWKGYNISLKAWFILKDEFEKELKL